MASRNSKSASTKFIEIPGQRQDLLNALRETVVAHDKHGLKSLYDLSIIGLSELLGKGDGATVRWYFDQFLEAPRTAVEQVIDNDRIFNALGKVLANHFPPEDGGGVVLDELREHLGHPD